MGIEHIVHESINFGFIIRENFQSAKPLFFTDNALPLQLAFMPLKQGDHIQAHKHHSFKREIHNTNEVIFVKKGSLRVNFFDGDNKQVQSVVLNIGDVIFLQEGGHSFDFLETCEIIEVKNGPYFGQEIDKLKF